MASTSPSPNSSPAAVPPASPPSPPSNSSPPSTTSPPPSTSSPPPDPSTASPPTQTGPNATSDPRAPTTPATPSAPPPQSPPPPVSSASPPDSSLSAPPLPPLPPPTPPPTSPPAVPTPPSPPPEVTSPPSPVLSPPPPAPEGSPPPASPLSPPPPQAVSPSPPPPGVSPPPPQAVSPSPPPPGVSPPPPQAVSPSPPPPGVSPPPPNVTHPLPSNSPPPSTKPPENSPPSSSAKPPANSSLPPPSLTPPVPSGPRPASPPSPKPPSQSPPPPGNEPLQPLPSPSSPVPPSNSSAGGTPSIPNLPSPDFPSGDPTGKSNNPNPNVPGNTNSGSGGINTGGAVAIGVAVGFIVLGLIGLAVWCLRKQKKKSAGYNGGYVMPSPIGSSPKSDSSYLKANSSAPLVGSGSSNDFVYTPQSEPGGLGNSRSWFTYQELVEVTDGFSAQNLLGEGGFGSVYKGCLADGREIAVKQLKIGGAQGEREFRAEVEIISRVHHRHLVSLVGYCISDHHRLLVYEYVPNNTLYYHLHEEGRPVMDWATRTRVAAGAARGIAYLHEDCHPRIIHRDIKSSNILLDNNFEARVSDFGLAKLALDTYTHVTTRVMGTFGYMAPEYASSGKLTEKSDVYSFGVVLLELITGRKPVDTSQPLGDESLVEWARPLLSDTLENEEFEGLIDPKLEKNYIESEMFRMIEAAAACVRHSAVKRPRMSQVMRALDGLGNSSDLSNGMRVGQSEIFDSAQQSAEIRMFQRMAFGSQDYSTDFFTQNSSS